MIDIHNHIIPGLDDGSKSLEMSMKMLKHASKQGITEIVNTVHYQHPKVDMNSISFDAVQIELENLQLELNKNYIPIKLHIGAEIFFLPNLLSLTDKPMTTLGNGKYMLIEFPLNLMPESQKQQLFDLRMSGVIPIIAHPERYLSIQRKPELVLNWLDAGCIIQVDAGSVLGYLGSKAQETSEIIIKNSWCQVIASDAHDDKKRNFCMKDAHSLIKSWIGEQAMKLFKENPYAIINGLNFKFEYDYQYQTKYSFKQWMKSKIGL